MKNLILLICCGILCPIEFTWSQSRKTNIINIDMTAKKVEIDAPIDFNSPVTLSFVSCDLLYDGKIRIGFTYKAEAMSPYELDCKVPFDIDFIKMLGEKPVSSIEISLSADVKSTNDGAFEYTFELDAGGKQVGEITIPSITGKEVLKSDVEFVDPQFLSPAATPALNFKGFTRVEYNPCTNKYNVFSNESNNPVEHIRYKKNTGVIFLIKDFNRLKYDVNVGKEFINNFTDVPALFTTVGDLFVNPGKVAHAANTENLGTELAKIIKLNQDLTEFLKIKMKDPDFICLTDFEDQKSAIIAKIKMVFKIADSENLLDFSKEYRTMKMSVIGDKQKVNTDYNSAKFNDEVKKEFSMEVDPDSLVEQTRMLLSTLVNTKFHYQYSIPQLQNADKIIFNISINPKKNMEGAIHMTDELIEVPLRGGWKIDFSTGFYYSNVKNREFGLKDVIRGDTLSAKEIIDEGVKNAGRHTAGITALMHIYPRVGSVQPSLTFGVGKSLDLNYSFLFGGSLLLGKDNRFAISSGFNFSNVKTLSNKYLNVDNTRMEVDKQATSVATVNSFKRGGFLSLTYSFGNRKVQKAASAEEKKKEKEE